MLKKPCQKMFFALTEGIFPGIGPLPFKLDANLACFQHNMPPVTCFKLFEGQSVGMFPETSRPGKLDISLLKVDGKQVWVCHTSGIQKYNARKVVLEPSDPRNESRSSHWVALPHSVSVAKQARRSSELSDWKSTSILFGVLTLQKVNSFSGC